MRVIMTNMFSKRFIYFEVHGSHEVRQEQVEVIVTNMFSERLIYTEAMKYVICMFVLIMTSSLRSGKSGERRQGMK